MVFQLLFSNSCKIEVENKGFFKAKTGKNCRSVYSLTSKGKTELDRLASAYQSHAIQFYRNSRSKMTDLFNKLYAQGVHRVAFFGAGESAEIAYVALHDTPIELVAVLDESRKGNKFFDYHILGIDNLPTASFQKLIITENHATENSIRKLKGASLYDNKIIYLF